MINGHIEKMSRYMLRFKCKLQFNHFLKLAREKLRHPNLF